MIFFLFCFLALFNNPMTISLHYALCIMIVEWWMHSLFSSSIHVVSTPSPDLQLNTNDERKNTKPFSLCKRWTLWNIYFARVWVQSSVWPSRLPFSQFFTFCTYTDQQHNTKWLKSYFTFFMRNIPIPPKSSFIFILAYN